MKKFDSRRWIKTFKAHGIVEKDDSIKLKDLLHTDKIDDQEYDGKSFQPKLDKSPKAKTGEENDLAIEKDKDGRDVYAVGLTEAPIQRSRVDYSTINLKSNIDIKWTSTGDMEDDLRQWLEAVFAASGPQLVREVGVMLKEIGISAIKDGDVGGEDRPAGAATKFD